MEYQANKIIENARQELRSLIYDTIVKIYLRENNNTNPDFSNDEEYEVEVSFTFKVEVRDIYTDEYYNEPRTASSVCVTLDGNVFVKVENEGFQDEFELFELSTEEMERLGIFLEKKLNENK